MNAAARLMNESLMAVSFSTKIQRLKISSAMIMVLSLMMAVIFSALILITMEDNNRIVIGHLTSLEHIQEELYTRYHQLLLEENTWASPERIEGIAEKNFAMIQPEAKKVIMFQP